MRKNLLDEDGRCYKSGLLPECCACAAHRGGQTPEEEAGRIDYNDYLIHRFMLAKYNGTCKLDLEHVIVPGDEIGLAVREDDLSKVVGWVCEGCTRRISYPEA